jgi:hypothetical protein
VQGRAEVIEAALIHGCIEPRTSVRWQAPTRSAGTIAAVSDPRYRCTACGNVTRFDVTTTRRTRAFHHYSLGGDLEIEDTEVLDELVEEVACRWCGGGGKVVSVDDAER